MTNSDGAARALASLLLFFLVLKIAIFIAVIWAASVAVQTYRRN